MPARPSQPRDETGAPVVPSTMDDDVQAHVMISIPLGDEAGELEQSDS